MNQVALPDTPASSGGYPAGRTSLGGRAVYLSKSDWFEIVQHLDHQTVKSLLLVNHQIRNYLISFIPGYESEITVQQVGTISRELLVQGAKKRRFGTKPTSTQVSNWFDSLYPQGLVLPESLKSVGTDSLANALKRRKTTLATELLGFDWEKLFQVNLDKRVLVTLPFIVAQTLILSTAPSLVSFVTRQTAAWISLPLQESTEIFARVLSVTPKGASFIAGVYLRFSSEEGDCVRPKDFGCTKLEPSNSKALWYSLYGEYGGWTWNWDSRWRLYLKDFQSDSQRLSIKHFRSVAASSGLELIDATDPRLVAVAPDSVAASVAARYGIETAVIFAQDVLSSGNPGRREFDEILKVESQGTDATLPFSKRFKRTKKRLNYDVPAACPLLRTEDDHNSVFTGGVKDLLSTGLRRRVRVSSQDHRADHRSINLPESTAFDILTESVAGWNSLLSTKASYLRIVVSPSSDSSRNFDLAFIPEDQDGKMVGEVLSGADLHHRVLQRFLGKIFTKRSKLDREIFTPSELTEVLGIDVWEELATHANDVLENRLDFYTSRRLEENSGSTEEEVFHAKIAYYTKEQKTYRTLYFEGRHGPTQRNGKRSNAVNPLILKLDDDLLDDAIRNGQLPDFPPKKKADAKNPPPIVGSINVTPPHYFNYGDTTYIDVTTLIHNERPRAAGQTATDKITKKIAELKAHDAGKAIAKSTATSSTASKTPSSKTPPTKSTSSSSKTKSTSSSSKTKSTSSSSKTKSTSSSSKTKPTAPSGSQANKPTTTPRPSSSSSSSTLSAQPPNSKLLTLEKPKNKGRQMKLAFSSIGSAPNSSSSTSQPPVVPAQTPVSTLTAVNSNDSTHNSAPTRSLVPSKRRAESEEDVVIDEPDSRRRRSDRIADVTEKKEEEEDQRVSARAKLSQARQEKEKRMKALEAVQDERAVGTEEEAGPDLGEEMEVDEDDDLIFVSEKTDGVTKFL
ncbi:uncharacterized protein JCM6883_006388 [Sporobolomyces salmoneus]|uniref:uncharacterized protein n=1 Tax=Sporobolomyces salmoneus TaxID=183962 RepID=UPI003181E669